MKIKFDESFVMFYKWWVVWPSNHHMSMLVHRGGDKASVVRTMYLYIKEHDLDVYTLSNLNQQSGFGFQDELEAMQFYLTFSSEGQILNDSL